jgi:hypothetical protein
MDNVGAVKTFSSIWAGWLRRDGGATS